MLELPATHNLVSAEESSSATTRRLMLCIIIIIIILYIYNVCVFTFNMITFYVTHNLFYIMCFNLCYIFNVRYALLYMLHCILYVK